MRIRNYATLAVFMCSLIAGFMIVTVVSAQAKEKINGAFGMRLGDTFDPASAIGKSSLTDGTPMYQFVPQNRFR